MHDFDFLPHDFNSLTQNIDFFISYFDFLSTKVDIRMYNFDFLPHNFNSPSPFLSNNSEFVTFIFTFYRIS